MCGILGVFDTNSSDKLEKTFNESLDLLKHRGPDDSGICSLIEKHKPNDIIQFKHLGTVDDGKEQSINYKIKEWSGATEIYSIAEGVDCNILSVAIDVLDEHVEFMTLTFPKALEKIKEISV